MEAKPDHQNDLSPEVVTARRCGSSKVPSPLGELERDYHSIEGCGDVINGDSKRHLVIDRMVVDTCSRCRGE